MAKLKNQEVKVSTYIPPHCCKRWSAAWSYAKNIEQEKDVSMVMVRLGKEDVIIMFKNSIFIWNIFFMFLMLLSTRKWINMLVLCRCVFFFKFLITVTQKYSITVKNILMLILQDQKICWKNNMSLKPKMQKRDQDIVLCFYNSQSIWPKFPA